jgi:succinoglycan biosynthesis protein ExoO
VSAYASVVVPTHDRASTLAYAIASIQAQSIAEIEILIVGDGPTQEVSEIAESIESQDKRVRFLRFDKTSSDGGPNCDRGVEVARSERILYCDDDELAMNDSASTTISGAR